MNRLLLAPLVLGLLGAALTLVLPRRRLLVAMGLAALASGATALLLADILQHGPVAVTMGNWPAPFGISFAGDAASAGFGLIAGLVTTAILLALSLEKTAPHPATGPMVLLLFAGVSGAVFTGDLFNLYVWFELMLIASFGLMAIGGTPRDLDATIKYGVLNLVGTTLFLIALGLAYGSFGTLNMADLARAVPQAPAVLQLGVAGLVLTGFLIKAAAFPVQVWLPASYHAPNPAISALFGALLTKVGVYVIFRVFTLSFAAVWPSLLPVFALSAGLTLLFAPLAAFAETDGRRALGFLVIGGIGTALTGLALGGADGIAGGLLYALQAMPVLAALYLLFGHREAGENAPVLRLVTLLLLLSLAGVPPFPGFWPKLLFLGAGFSAGGIGLWLALALLLNAFLTLLAVARLFSQSFWNTNSAGRPGRAAALPVTLGVLALLPGIFPAPLTTLAEAGSATLRDRGAYSAAVGLPGDRP